MKDNRITMDSLAHARAEYIEGNITFDKLNEVFYEKASKQEKERFWASPVYDRAGVILGKSKIELDKDWKELLHGIKKPPLIP